MGTSYKLDRVDVSIAELLQEDGRMMYKDIADRVGVSLPTVKARITRMTELGVIKKFTAVLDGERLAGFVRSFITARVGAGASSSVDLELSKLREVRSAHHIAGDKQLLLDVQSDDPRHLDELFEKLSGLGLTDFSVFVVTRTVKEEYGAKVKLDAAVEFRCRFCDCVIYGKPVVRLIHGGKYYFSGEECARAFEEQLNSRQASRKH